jgi:CheY-like chemotaxis protein
VKSLVDLHDGRVEARSDGPGKGAEFIVCLPLAAEPAEAPAPRVAAMAVQQGRHVLVVDDNEDAARTLGELLAAQGHRVVVHLSGAEALAAAEANPPEVAFLDLNMPGMDGFELARCIRATSWGRAIHLVAVTGMGHASDVEHSREVGFDAHLTKPADPERILHFASAEREAADTVVPFPRARA